MILNHKIQCDFNTKFDVMVRDVLKSFIYTLTSTRKTKIVVLIYLNTSLVFQR